MASQKIDELQINIGSDATAAIRQLDSLAQKLNATATAATALASATESLNGFASAISKLAGADASTAATNIKALNSALGGKNLKSKTVTVDFSITGMENIEKLKNLSLPDLNNVKLKGTGINSFVNALRKLAGVDMSKFDTKFIDVLADAAYDLSKLDGIDKSILKFVSALTRLASVGDNTSKAADGLVKLAEAIKKAVATLQGIGDISADLSVFIAALGKLASAGENTGKTADGLHELADAIVYFLNEVSKAPPVDPNLASTIQGLGMLSLSGKNAQKAMSESVNDKDAKEWAGIVTKALGDAAKTLGHDLKVIFGQIGALGAKGASALGKLFQKLHMLPSAAADVDRMAISFGNLLRAIIPFYGIKGIFDWAKQSFEAGSSIVELQNVIDTAFGSIINGYKDISGYIYNWSKDTIDAFGVSELAAQRYAGKLMSMFNSSGFDASEAMRDSAAKMTTDLVERAGDIASFYDISVDEAMTKMQAALAGMTRPMRALGVNMNVANLEAFALSQGIHQSWQEMDQATQMAVRYAYMLDATKYAEGDFGRTAQSAANQVRLLQLNTQQLSATLGQGLVSAIAPVIGWLNGLIKRLIQAAVAFRTFMWTLFGKPLAAVRGLVDDTAGFLDDAAGAAGDLGSAGGGAADGLGSAGKAAKDLKKQLTVLPFDELNQLAKDTDSAGSGGSGGGGGGGVGGIGSLGDMGLVPDLGDALTVSPVINAISQWAARIREAFQKQQWANLGRIVAEGINAGFAYLYDVLDWNNLKPIIVDGFIVPFQTAFNTMMNFIKWEQIGATLARGLNDIVYTLRAWITGFEWRNYGIDFGTLLNRLVSDWDAGEFGRLIADKFKAAWDFFGGWVDTFNFKIFGTKLEEMILNGLDELDPADMGATLGKFVTGLADTINTLLGDGQVKTQLASAFGDLVNGFINDLDEDKVKEAVKNVIGTISGVFWKTIKNINLLPLIDDLLTILSGLPWAKIGIAIVSHVLGAIGKSLTGGIATKLVSDLIVKAFTGGGGFALGGAAGATTAAGGATMAAETINLSGPLTVGAGAAAAGAGTGVTGKQKLTGLITGGIAGGTFLASLGIKKLMSMFGGSKASSQNQQPSDGTGAGQYFGTPTVPSTPSAPSPQSKATPSTPSGGITNTTIQTTLVGKEDPSFKNLLNQKAALMETPQVQKLLNGELTPGWKTSSKSWFSIFDMTNTKKLNGQETSSYKSTRSTWLSWISQTILKTANGTPTSKYNSTRSNWLAWVSQTINKKADSSVTGAYTDIKSRWFNWVSQTILKTADGFGTKSYWNVSGNYDSLDDKNITLGVYQKRGAFDNLGAYIQGKWDSMLEFEWYAKGGMFTGPTAISVFGEAGAEAAIPLERKSTMKRIASAIVDSGGMGTSNSDEIADAIAMRVLPAMASMMDSMSQRPINNNVTVYTENNEVLARAVNQGNKSLDKRYNPISQYSY